MRWTRLAYAGLLPLAAGCHDSCFTARDLVGERRSLHNEEALTRELRRDARCAWREVRAQFPRRMFSEEFREGFLDGYTDYLDRGGDASPPLAPPAKLTRHKKYYSPEGQALLKDYLLGFKYGTDVAVATGCRQFMTVPVLMPVKEAVCPPASAPLVVEPVPPTVVVPTPDYDPRGANPVVFPSANPLPVPKPVANGKPAAKPDSPPMELGQKFQSAQPKPETRQTPPTASNITLPATIPDLPPPPLPTTPRSASPAKNDVQPVSYSESKFVPNPATIRLPEPPVEVPLLPDGVPTPSVTDDLPMIPQLPK